MTKLPLPPGVERLRRTRRDEDLVAVAEHTVLWRVHDSVGEHVVAWNELRRFGPVGTARFDPHRPPPRIQREGVTYAALDLPTTLAERFQSTRLVNRWRGAPVLTAWRPTRALHLLDLTDAWPVRAGASHAVNTGSRSVARAWARAIRAAWPDLDGLWYRSSMTGRPCVALWQPAARTFPARPAFSQALAHPGLGSWLEAAAAEIGYRLL